ncbi:MAG TPA: BrnT family toxin [Thermoanaerobaculia bacterium]|nr:BrnT family toxin [Thermoanaerobaculia bacterium]
MLQYEWDEAKEAANERKHGITFEEACTIFLDPLAATYADPDHSVSELRFITFGRSDHGRLLVVAHQEQSEERIRIISARLLTRREAYAYQEER